VKIVKLVLGFFVVGGDLTGCVGGIGQLMTRVIV